MQSRKLIAGIFFCFIIILLMIIPTCSIQDSFGGGGSGGGANHHDDGPEYHDSLLPFLVWNGNGYGITWVDYRNGNSEIYYARINADGTKIGNDVRITNAVHISWVPSLAWNGDRNEYGVIWTDYRNENNEIYFARINADGTINGNDVCINDKNGLTIPLVWSGNEYGLVFNYNFDIYFTRINAAGTKIGNDVQIFID